MIGVAWLSCQSFQKTLCVEALVIARDILLVFILEFLQMLEILSTGITLKPILITWIAAPQIISASQPGVIVPQESCLIYLNIDMAENNYLLKIQRCVVSQSSPATCACLCMWVPELQLKTSKLLEFPTPIISLCIIRNIPTNKRIGSESRLETQFVLGWDSAVLPLHPVVLSKVVPFRWLKYISQHYT